MPPCDFSGLEWWHAANHNPVPHNTRMRRKWYFCGMIRFTGALKIAVLFAPIFLAGCAKDEPDIPGPGDDPIPEYPPYFAWKIDGGPTRVADSSYAYVQSHVLFAFKNTGEGLEVNLSSMSEGTYTISMATGNMLQYDDGSATYDATGEFVINDASSGRLSGYFDCGFTGGPLTAISGTFADVPVR